MEAQRVGGSKQHGRDTWRVTRHGCLGMAPVQQARAHLWRLHDHLTIRVPDFLGWRLLLLQPGASA
eukprot:364904-Chlamydomonas_euryale.AAC.12